MQQEKEHGEFVEHDGDGVCGDAQAVPKQLPPPAARKPQIGVKREQGEQQRKLVNHADSNLDVRRILQAIEAEKQGDRKSQPAPPATTERVHK